MPLFRNEQTSSLADLVTKVNAFLTLGGAGNPGWTADHLNAGAGQWAISKDDGAGQSVEVAFQWDTGTPDRMAVYHYRSGSGAGNYNNGLSPWQQVGDSGNGAASTNDGTINGQRKIRITNTPVQYWAFADSLANAYIVIQHADLSYRHLVMGVLEKENDWVGGEFAAGYRVDDGGSSDVAVRAESSMLLDGHCNGTAPAMQFHAATVHVEGLTDSPVGGLWAVVMGNQNVAQLGNDRQAAPKARIMLTYGFRSGPYGTSYGQFIGTQNFGYVPTYPIALIHRDRNISGTSSTDGALTPPLGFMKDCRGILLTNFVGEETIDIDGDTWHIFPSRVRWDGAGSLASTTGYQGIMYKEN